MKYDATGFATSYLLLIFVLPITIYAFYKTFYRNKKTLNFDCNCTPCLTQRKSSNDNYISLFMTKFIICPILLSFMIYLIYNVFTLQHQKLKGIFDPYQILDVSEDAPKKVIRRKFLKLSVLHDPDRYNDIQEKAENEKMLQDISRAYNMIKTGKLIQRERYEEIIAIPLLLLENVKYSCFSIVIYVILFGVLLPMKMYFNYKKYSMYNKIGVSYDSMEIFYNQILKHNQKSFDSTLRQILNMICDSKEFQEKKYKLQIDKNTLKTLIESQYAVPLRDSQKMNMAYALLMIHLFRVPNIEYDVSDMKFTLAKAFKLSEGIKSLALSLNNQPFFYIAILFKKMLIQAVCEPSYAALQCPNVTFLDIFKFYHSDQLNKNEDKKIQNIEIEDKSRKITSNVTMKESKQDKKTDFNNKNKAISSETKIDDKSTMKTHDPIVNIINSIDFPSMESEKQCLHLLDSLPRKIIKLPDLHEGEKDSIYRLKMTIQNIKEIKENESDDTYGYGVLIREDGEQDLVLKNNYGKYVNVPLHAPYFPIQQKLTWSLHTIIDKQLSEQIFVFNGDFHKKEVFVDVPLGKENSIVDLVLVCDGYFGCDVDKKIIIKVK